MNNDSKEPPQELTRSDPVHTALAFECALGLVALAIGLARGSSPWWQMHGRSSDILWALAATAPMVAAMLAIMHTPVAPLRRLRELVVRVIHEVFGTAKVWELALLAVAAGLGEELLFRGVIQTWFVERGNPLVGLMVASLIFGMAHFLSLTYFVVATLVGLYLGWLALHFENLLVPVIVHALYDFLALVYLRHQTP